MQRGKKYATSSIPGYSAVLATSAASRGVGTREDHHFQERFLVEQAVFELIRTH
jgi:hypothetical protein